MNPFDPVLEVWALINAIPRTYFTANANGTIQAVNNTVLHMSGFTEKKLIGQPLTFLFPKDDLEKIFNTRFNGHNEFNLHMRTNVGELKDVCVEFFRYRYDNQARLGGVIRGCTSDDS